MIRHILTIIWNQRSSNVWIFLELLLVAVILLTMTDSLLVDTYTYCRPLGVDTNNTYVVSFNKLEETTDTTQQREAGENILELTDHLRQCPEVEAAGLGLYSCPYSYANSYSVMVREGDTTKITQENMMSNLYHQLVVDVDYFRVFRMQTKEGKPLYDEVMRNPGTIALSADAEAKFFHGESGVGKRLKYSVNSPTSMTIAAVTTSIRVNDYSTGEERYYDIIRTDQEWIDLLKRREPTSVQAFIRMKDGFNPEGMEGFLQAQGERLEVGNVYVSSVTPLKKIRADMLKERQDNQKKKAALVAFMLVNIFFGITGTFWLRTQSRRAEIGLRSALGASKSKLCHQLYAEGWLLLLLTLPFVLVYLMNMLYLDMPDTERLDYTWWRFLATMGITYLILGVMIYLGIRLPAGKIVKMNPAETLHYE